MSDHLPDEVVVKVEEEEAKGRSVHIPNGVVVEILLRLPPKTLVRCRCVCKDWYSLISSNTFVASHTKRALSQSCDNNESNLVLLRYKRILDLGAGRSHIFFSLVSDDASFVFTEDLTRLDFPSNSARYFPERLLCSFNGLLCFAEYQLLKLWNPSIHKVLSLPKPNITSLTHGSYVDFHGLGYDPSSNDLKLVRLVYPERHPDKVPPLVEIFTLISSCWREITAPGPSYMIKQHCFSVFLNGASHWIAHTSPHEHTFRNVIVSFDMVGEVFREIAVPSSFVRKSPLEMTLAVRDGLLCLVPRYPLSEQQFSSVWIMKEYGIRESWTKLFDIHLNEGLARVVGFRKNGEVLVTDGEGELLSYEPNTQQVTHLGFHEQRSHRIRPQCTFFFNESCYFWEKYMETILLLNMKKLVSKASTIIEKR